jgi:hypothetical protein
MANKVFDTNIPAGLVADGIFDTVFGTQTHRNSFSATIFCTYKKLIP